jgi:hypothetical protein
MRNLIPAIAALVTLGFGDPPKHWIWKRVESDSSDVHRWLDSLSYDSHGKLLAEYRSDAEALPVHSIRYHYDDSGRSEKAVMLSPDDKALEEAVCTYSGTELVNWTRTVGNITMDGISFHNDPAGNRIVSIQVAMKTYRFTLDKKGKSRKVALSGGMAGGTFSSAEFGFDSRQRHVSTRFFGADSAPIGRDTLLYRTGGGMRELRRFDDRGRMTATVEFRYGARGELDRKSLKNAKGKISLKVEQFHLTLDSLARLNRLESAWNGPAATGHCDLTWFRNVKLGIEPVTLYGLFMPQAGDELKKPFNPNAFRDSLDRARDDNAARLDAFRAGLGACRAKPKPACIEKAYADIDRMVNSRNGGWRPGEAMDTAVGLLLELGGDRAYAKLLAMAKVDTPYVQRGSGLIDRLLTHRLGMAYLNFCRISGKVERRVKPKDAMRTGPPGNLPESLREAWHYRRSILDGGKSESPLDTAATVKWTYPELYGHILAFLRQEKPELLESIKPYQIGGWCGTGSESLYRPKGDAMLIAVLERGDMVPALLATQDGERIRQMLICRDLDWEAFFLGGILDYEYEFRSIAMKILAKYGSLDVLRQLLLLDPDVLYGNAHLTGYAEVLGAFLLGPGSRLHLGDSGKSVMDYVRDADSPALPADLRQQVLDRLTAKIEKNPFKVDALVFVRILSGVEFPRRGEYLKRLAAVPYRASRAEALRELKKAGIEPGSLPSFEPVLLEMVSNGKPFPEGSMMVAPPCKAGSDKCSDWSSSSSISGGRYSVSRSEYLSLWRESKAMRLSNYYPGYENPLDGLIFNVTIPIAETPAEPIVIDIPLRRVVLDLEYPRTFAQKQEKKIQVRTKRLEKEAGGYPTEFGLSMRRQVAFSALGDGFYQFGLEIPGLQSWTSGRIEVRGNATHVVELKKGSDLKYLLRSKWEGDSAYAVKVTLRHATMGVMTRGAFEPPGELRLTTGHADMFKGLPLGDYSLEVSSIGKPSKLEKASDKVRTFVIAENSPDLVDLGEIWHDGP